jgi:hypothetical protein
MQVWRVENSTGEGPYSACTGTGWMKRDHDGEDHPSPWEDELLRPFWVSLRKSRVETHWLFGFESKEALTKWFTQDELKALTELGFAVKAYDAEQVRLGRTQLIFLKRVPSESVL